MELTKSFLFFFILFICHKGCRNYTSCALLKRYRVIHSSKISFLNVFNFRVVFYKHQLNNPTNWNKQMGALFSKAGRRVHILRVCKKYGYSLDSLHHLFHSLIVPIFTYGISIWDVASYDKFQKRAVRFGFLKKVLPV